MGTSNTDLDELVREELGAEPSQEAKDYARRLYEKYRLPDTLHTPVESRTGTETCRAALPSVVPQPAAESSRPAGGSSGV
ncbi:hypothetical protein [Thermobifida cellulosilytica]|uniref:Uncharacterized protein n=1 Tax=Thermobifida cellulosilytica TB100 TaxID=665004 RepID=A0A147KEW5_THECS|nr:hypothetical protein [Thermobifida cellulosilytica]KUP95835.1 hypothetical protein AC529_15470 [Thermobifida cellulosilytica TB100]